jgi:hydroxyethylthiazole kinase-like uncharacterized protein yjeF
MPGDPVFRIAEVRALERGAFDPPLMERAGLGAAELARGMLGGRSGTVRVLAGPGNNGGDAFVVARHLRGWFYDVAVSFVGDAARLGADARAAHAAWLACGGSVESEWPANERPALVVDGLFGIGLTRGLEPPFADWVVRANGAQAPVLALDVPSGLDAGTGVAREPTIRADVTATFIALKPGLLTADGPDRCGRIDVLDLGIDVAGAHLDHGTRLDWPPDAGLLPDVLRRARRNVHKGSFGTLAIIGGGEGMVGACLLAGRAALLLGAGKVFVGLASGTPQAVDPLMPELMLRPARDVLTLTTDAKVIGPGLGRGDDARSLVDAALAGEAPIVLDADALNLIAGDDALRSSARLRKAPTLLTPHPAEAARLAQTQTAAIQNDRVAAAIALASDFNAVVILKGAGSVIASMRDRDRIAWAINATGNPGLASAGSGDVLSGMAGALLAQGIDAFTAAQLAASLHGAAADAMVAHGTGPLGLTASEIAPEARTMLNRVLHPDTSRPSPDATR